MVVYCPIGDNDNEADKAYKHDTDRYTDGKQAQEAELQPSHKQGNLQVGPIKQHPHRE